MAGKTWVIGGGVGRGGVTFQLGKDSRRTVPSAKVAPHLKGFKERSLNEVPRFTHLMRQFPVKTETREEERRSREANRRLEEEEEEEEDEDVQPLNGTWEADLQTAASLHDLQGVRRGLAGCLRRADGKAALTRCLAASNSDGQTTLHLCATGSRKACAETWSRSPGLFHGYPGSAKGAASEPARIVELLVEARAFVDATNMLGETPLLAAVRAPASAGVVRALLRCKADPDRLEGLTGETALMEAACSGAHELCSVLLEYGADPSCRNPQGQTAFDLALASGCDRASLPHGLEPTAEAKAMPAKAADVVEEDCSMELRAAIKAVDAAEVQKLLASVSPAAAVAALEVTDGSCRTPLHLCATAPDREGAAGVVEALLEHRASPEACDAFGRTALEVAVEAGSGTDSPEEFPAATLETISMLLSTDAVPSVIGMDSAAASRTAGRCICTLLESFGVAVEIRLAEGHEEENVPCEDGEGKTAEEMPGESPESAEPSPAGGDQEITPGEPDEESQRQDGVRPAQETSTEGDESELPNARSASDPPVCQQQPAQEDQDESPAQDATAHEADLAEAPPVSEPPAPAPAQQRGRGGLRQRCEEHGIPLDKLGTFLAAPALKECERLRQLGLDELLTEVKASGLVAPDSNSEDQEQKLREMLKQVYFWKVMPLSALQAECKAVAADVVETLGLASNGRALEREELLEALTIATWGGRTRNESLRQQCQAKGIPLERLADLDQVSDLLERVANLEKLGLSELKNEYKRRGYAPQAQVSKEDMIKSLAEVFACEQMPLSSLRDLCKDRKLSITGDMRRAEIMQFMANHSWEARYIPVEKLPSYTVACGLLDQVDRLEAKSLTELKNECRRRSLPFDALGEKKDLVRCITHVAVWGQLSIEQLREECKDRGCDTTRVQGLVPVEDTSRKALEEKLSGALLLELWRQKGVDARIESQEVAVELFRRIGHLEEMSENELRREHLKLGHPAEAVATRAEVLQRLTKHLVWNCLPLAALRKEAQQLEVSISGLGRYKDEASQCELLALRLFAAVVREAWEANGIPVKRLGGMEAASVLVQEQNSLELIREESLRAKYTVLGMPEEVGGLPSREELLKRLRLVSLWRRLPLKELVKECRDSELRGSNSLNAEELVERLIVGLALDSWQEEGIHVKRIETIAAAKRVVDRVRHLKRMSAEELKAEYAKLDLPGDAEEAPGKEVLLTRLEKVARWRELSVKELQKECKEADVSIGGISSNKPPDEHQRELVARLVLATCAGSWESKGVPVRRIGAEVAARYAAELERLTGLSEEDLRREYRGLGLPAGAGRVPDKEEVLSRLKLHVLWQHLPVHELRKECQERNVSMGSLSGALSDEAGRKEVLERLVLVLFADSWEARGLPLRRLGSIQAATALTRDTERLNSASDDDLRDEYAGLHLPADAPPPDGPKEMLRRLKQVLLWQHLPLHELRKECQERHVSCVGEDSKQLVGRLVLATWGPYNTRPDTSGQQSRPGFGIPKGQPKRPHWEQGFPGRSDHGRSAFSQVDPMQAMTKQLKALELSPGANAEDVKRAYKKLALKYHPDKNLGDTQEEASSRFREVQASYEALCKFFEDHPQRPAPGSGVSSAGRPRAGPPTGMPSRGGPFFPGSRR